MMTVSPIVLRLALASAITLFALKSPCLCGTPSSQAVTSCCSSQIADDMGGQEPNCGGCCSSSESSNSPHDGSKLCCASGSIDCKQADSGSWNLGTQPSTQELIGAATSQLLAVAVEETFPSYGDSIYERVLPAAHRSINISTHLLRI